MIVSVQLNSYQMKDFRNALNERERERMRDEKKRRNESNTMHESANKC